MQRLLRMPSILEDDCQKSPLISFRINREKDKAEAPAVDILRLRHQNSIFSTPK